MLVGWAMKQLAAIIAASLALFLGEVRDASACADIPSCSVYHCLDQVAVIEARLVDLGAVRSGGADRLPRLQIESAFGDAPEAQPGTEVTLLAYDYVFQVSDVGQTFILYAERTPGGELRLFGKLTAAQLGMCFSDEATADAVAATVLSPACAEELTQPAERTLGFTACVEPAPLGCSAGGSGAGAGVVLALGLIALARRRR